MYEYKTRVRYSETDENSFMSLLAMMNQLQDCSTFHSTDVGLSVESLTKMKRAWLLSNWDIYIDRVPKLCEEIFVGTSPHQIKGMLAKRNFWIKDAKGNYLLRADSVWFSYDIEKQMPARVEDKVWKPFEPLEDVLKLSGSNRKIELSLSMEEGEHIHILRQHIDSNHHVNNAQYIDFAISLLEDRYGNLELFTEKLDSDEKENAENKSIWSGKHLKVEYRKAAVLGDELISYMGRNESDSLVVSLQDREGKVYCNVEIG